MILGTPDQFQVGEINITSNSVISDAQTRSSTPTDIRRSDTPFSSLSRQNQVIALRPHLADIILERYAPAQWRSDEFYDTANKRDGSKHSVKHGNIGEDEITSIILPELERWALRADRWLNFDQGVSQLRY